MYENSLESKSHKEARELFESFLNYTQTILTHEFCDKFRQEFDLNLGFYIKTLQPRTILYRARLIENEDDITINASDKFKGYNKENSFVPPAHLTKAGRLNFAQKPYLYVSDHNCTAILEVRPRLGEKVSLANITVNKELKLLNLVGRMLDIQNQGYFADALKDLISIQLSEPFPKNQDVKYLPLQGLALLIKDMGYDGIAYRSAMNVEAENYCIFNFNDCEAISSDIYKIMRMEIRCLKNDTDDLAWIQSEGMEKAQQYNIEKINKEFLMVQSNDKK